MRGPSKKKWARGDVIAVIGVMVAVVGVVAAVLGPLREEKPPSNNQTTLAPSATVVARQTGAVNSQNVSGNNNSAIQAVSDVAGGATIAAGNIGTINLTSVVRSPEPARSPKPPNAAAEPIRPDTWLGDYTVSYVDGERKLAIYFNCNFESPAFTGLSYEPLSSLRSGISGIIRGDSVHFTKTAESGLKLRFDGTFDRSTKTIEGTWTDGADGQGKFLIHRSPVPFEIK